MFCCWYSQVGISLWQLPKFASYSFLILGIFFLVNAFRAKLSILKSFQSLFLQIGGTVCISKLWLPQRCVWSLYKILAPLFFEFSYPSFTLSNVISLRPFLISQNMYPWCLKKGRKCSCQIKYCCVICCKVFLNVAAYLQVRCHIP